MEWDSRAMALAAFRFHGTGLFPRDLGADLAQAMCPPGWKILYWIGTLFTDPYQVSRLLPFGIFPFLLWQVFAFVRGRAGNVVAAASVFLVARCPFFWDRIVGANPRAFGLPLVVAFLRYATERRPLATTLVLIAQAAFYPSALLLCAPAFAALQLAEAIRARRLRPLFLLAACGLVCGALALPTAISVDPRLGPPIRIEQLASLRQRAVWSLYPLPSHAWVFKRAAHITLEDEVEAPLLVPEADLILGRVVMALAALIFLIGAIRRRIPAAFWAVACSSVVAYVVACKVAYRLYVPDRMVHYAAPPLILLLLVPLAVEALSRSPSRRGLPPRTAALVGSVVIAVLTVLAGDLGLSHAGLRNWSSGRTLPVAWLGGRPIDVLVAAHPTTSSFVEVFAHRSTLFSGITNAPNFVQYGQTVEARIAAFYDAYYASELDDVRTFVRREGIDYLIVDTRDFGKDALTRAQYVTPWTQYAQARVRAAQGRFALAAIPPDAVGYQDATVLVVDAKKL